MDLHSVVLSIQHKEGYSVEKIKEKILPIIENIIPHNWKLPTENIFIKPTGNSAGLIIVLEIRSDSIIINAPASIDPFKRKLCLEEITMIRLITLFFYSFTFSARVLLGESTQRIYHRHPVNGLLPNKWHD